MDRLKSIIDCSFPPPHRTPVPPSFLGLRIADLATRSALGRRLVAEWLCRSVDSRRFWALTDLLCRLPDRSRWAGDRLSAIWRDAPDPARRVTGRFLGELVRGPDEVVAEAVLPGELVVVLPAADRTVVDRLAWPADNAGALLDLSGLPARPANPACRPIAADLRSRDISEEWFVRAEAHADRVFAVLLEALDGSAVGDLLAAHRETLSFTLRHEIAAILRPLDVLRRVVGDLRPLRIRLLEGHYPADAFVAELEAAGVPLERIRIDRVEPNPRIEARRAGRSTSAMHPQEPESAVPSATALAEAVAGLRAMVSPWSLRGRAVIVADLRDSRDFRHHANATTVLAAAARRRTVVLLQPYAHLNLRLARSILHLFRRFGTRVRPALVRVPHVAAARLADVTGWRTPLLAAVARDLRPETPRAVADCAAVLEATGIFLAGHLPAAVALLRDLDRAFDAGAPTHLCSVPAGKPVALLAASAARARAVVSLDVQTLLIGTSRRDAMPLADHVAVVDDAQADLNARRFGISPRRLVLVGRQGYVEARLAALAQPRVPHGRHRVLFASQPLVGLAAKTVAAILEACARRSDVDLTITPHPDESAEAIETYRRLAAASPAAERTTIASAGVSTADLIASDVVVTIASNVGQQAAIMERDVLVANLSENELPVRFDRSGLALYADTEDGIAAALDALLDDPATRAALARTRADYLERNPQFLSGSTSEHIVDFLERVAADGRSPIRCDAGRVGPAAGLK